MAESGGDGAEGPLGLVLGAGSPLGLSDGALVERFAAWPGSASGAAAFEALVARHGGMVRWVCRQTLRSDADADDAYQAVFLVLARRAGAIRDPDLLAPWLYGVALRTARLARRRRRGGETLVVEPVAAGPRGCAVEAGEAAEALHAEVARLPEAQRRAVILCHLEGLTHDEAARRLGIPTGTVSVRLMRARERLRSALTRRGFAPGASIFPAPALARDGAIPPRAWAALSHLRGYAAGEVPVGIASLASGALSMTPSVAKVAALALLATGLTATGAWSLAQAPARTDQASPPASGGKPAPPSKVVENQELLEFRKAYHLEPGQIVKRIPPPFARWRMAELVAQTADLNEDDLTATSVSYEERDGRQNVEARFCYGDPNKQGVPLAALIKELSRLRFPTIEGPTDLLQTPVQGDWVVAAASSIPDRLAALNSILREECKISIRLSREDQDREVMVARGSFQPRPLLAGRKEIQFYGSTIVGEQDRVSALGDSAGFLGDLGRFVAPQRIMIDEIMPDRRLRIRWERNARNPATEQTTREDRDEASVLRHVAEQTGLSFTTERRRVPIITVERTD